MVTEANYLDVTIMGKEYRVGCMPEERDALLAAVELVDGKMRDIAQRTRNTVAERVAVMAALNIAHQYLAKDREPMLVTVDTSSTKRRIEDMGARLDAVLASQHLLDM